MKALVGGFNQEKALVEALSLIMNPRADLRLKVYPGHGAAQRGAAAEERGGGEAGQGEEVHRSGGRRGSDLHHHAQELGGAGGHQLARSAAR